MTEDQPPPNGHTVVVLPVGISLHVDEGETIFAAANRSGIAWPTRCLGRASCRTCYFEVDANSASVAPPSRLEADALGRMVLPPPPRGRVRRLACQARVLTDVVVHRLGVRYRHDDE